MIYGFISSLDDETTKVFFRSKKIRGNSIYSAGSLGELTSVLQSGDVVYTVSCNRFASVRQVYTFARFCHERGIGCGAHACTRCPTFRFTLFGADYCYCGIKIEIWANYGLGL